MKANKRRSILFSRSEERVLKTLEQRWAPRLRVYPNLPLSTVVDMDAKTLDRRESAFFYKTNVDYTICTASNEPILCIELDGIGAGREALGVYVASDDFGDEQRAKREWTLNFKLQICDAANLPLVIVNHDDCRSLYDEELSLLDLFVSDILIEQRERELKDEGIAEHMREYGEMTEDEFETIDIGAGIDAEREFDIAEHRVQEIVEQLRERGVDVPFPVLFTGAGYGKGALRLQPLEYPPTPAYKGAGFLDLAHLKWLKEVRLPALQKVQRFGCLATYDESASVKHIGVGPVWVTNSRAIKAGRIAEKVALLMLYKSMLRSVTDEPRL